MMRGILVTGAGGFIGGYVARLLAAQPRLTVYGATRSGRRLEPGISPCKLDVRIPSSFNGTLRNIDIIVHCAVGDRATTIDGTRNVLNAARDAGVARVIHLSSVSVYGAASGAVTETTALVSPGGKGYAHWKSAAEAECRVVADLQVIILRLAIVYGPGSRFWITMPAQRVLGGAWGGLGKTGRGTCNPVHVQDVAIACLAAIKAANPASPNIQDFNISGNETLSWAEWYADLARALGQPPLRDRPEAAWRFRMMAGLPLKAAARLLPAAGRMLRRQILASPAQSELDLFALQATYPSRKAADLLGWTAQTPLAAGLAESAAWFRATEPVP